MGVFMESSLMNSILFQTLNAHGSMTKIVNDCIQNAIVIDSTYIEEQLLQIKRTHISPLVDKVLDAYNNGTIVLLYSKVTKVPQPLPFTVLKVQNKIRAYVFLNNYGTISDKGKVEGGTYLNMPMKDLYVLMEAAYVSQSYYTYPNNVIKNLGMMRMCTAIYTNMILRILNREYALSMEPEVYNRVSFVLSKFFLENIWESKNDDINTNYAINVVLNPNRQDLLIINEQYRQKGIKTIEQLIAFLKEVTPRLEKLNMAYFTQCYLNLYKASALFGMECLPYFLYTVQASLIGSFLVNQPIISDITKAVKGMNTFYAELSKVV